MGLKKVVNKKSQNSMVSEQSPMHLTDYFV